MRIGIISLKGKSSREIAEACRKFFSHVDELNLKDFEVHLNGGLNVTHLKKDLEKYDCLYIRGSHRYSILQRSITRAFSKEVYMPIKHGAFTVGHDKFLTLLELHKNNVAIPKTSYAATKKLANKILEEVKYPIIMKTSQGTQGKGVMIAESIKSARTILDVLEESQKPYLIQEFVETKQTSDIRAIVLGNKVISSYKRIAQDGEIRSNIHAGGKRERHDLTEQEKQLAIDSAEAIGAKICGVDILDSENPSVIEINLSPGISSIKEITDINVPEKIAEYLYERTKKFKKRRKAKLKKKLKKKNGLSN
jgi:ribosomal protein S6--L-glutamate ligase